MNLHRPQRVNSLLVGELDGIRQEGIDNGFVAGSARKGQRARKYQNGDSRMNCMSCAISRLADLTNGLYFGSAHWLILPRTGGEVGL